MSSSPQRPNFDPEQLSMDIHQWGKELGFQQVGIAGIALDAAETRLTEWLAAGYHGEMEYMARHGAKRSRPAELLPGTLSVISVRLDYLPEAADPWATLQEADHAYVSRYALGRDYHKLMRGRLEKLAQRIAREIGPFAYRVYSDSAPVLERPIAAAAGLGWVGKHTNLLTRKGSWFFLGEIYTDLPLVSDAPVESHCGTCRACLDVCPTKAFVAPYILDARRCISYLTIEHRGSIPPELRPLIGNRIYGCDDCQLVCPWNRFANLTQEHDFSPRNSLDRARLIELFAWSEAEFLKNTEGSPLRRLGHEQWLRNIAVALGNANTAPEIIAALQTHRDHPSELVRDHVGWALDRHTKKNSAFPE